VSSAYNKGTGLDCHQVTLHWWRTTQDQRCWAPYDSQDVPRHRRPTADQWPV